MLCAAFPQSVHSLVQERATMSQDEASQFVTDLRSAFSSLEVRSVSARLFLKLLIAGLNFRLELASKDHSLRSNRAGATA